jgi:hypothetical protein
VTDCAVPLCRLRRFAFRVADIGVLPDMHHHACMVTSYRVHGTADLSTGFPPALTLACPAPVGGGDPHRRCVRGTCQATLLRRQAVGSEVSRLGEEGAVGPGSVSWRAGPVGRRACHHWFVSTIRSVRRRARPSALPEDLVGSVPTTSEVV